MGFSKGTEGHILRGTYSPEILDIASSKNEWVKSLFQYGWENIGSNFVLNSGYPAGQWVIP